MSLSVDLDPDTNVIFTGDFCSSTTRWVAFECGARAHILITILLKAVNVLLKALLDKSVEATSHVVIRNESIEMNSWGSSI